MFKIGLGGGDAPLLEHKEILMDLLLIELSGDFAIMQCDGRNVHRIVLECARATTQH